MKASDRSKLLTDERRARRQTSLRLLRLREACGVTQAELASRVGVTKRAIGSLERAEVRSIALLAFFELFDQVVEEQGLDAALSAILTARWNDTELPEHGVRKTAPSYRNVAAPENAEGSALAHPAIIQSARPKRRAA